MGKRNDSDRERVVPHPHHNKKKKGEKRILKLEAAVQEIQQQISELVGKGDGRIQQGYPFSIERDNASAAEEQHQIAFGCFVDGLNCGQRSDASDLPIFLPRTIDYVVVDLKATCEKGVNVNPQEIIELSSILVDAVTGEQASTFHTYVTPEIHPKLSGRPSSKSPFLTISTGGSTSRNPLRRCLVTTTRA